MKKTIFPKRRLKNFWCTTHLILKSSIKILNFNFKPGQELPVHNHDIEGQLSLVILEGEGEFLGEGDATMPAKPGDVVISEIAEPHGLRAKTNLRLLVTIAPPI
jgi:quercetin dioxygenase-like cupin family protein